jgi:lysine 6-dehydrogenase
MRIIVLGGCGAMGSEATRDLAQTSDFEEIVIADADLKRAQALADELGSGRVRALQANASDEAALAAMLRGFDVVANCTTYHFGLHVTRAAIAASVNYLDLGGLFNTPRQLELDEEAKRTGVTICLGCGATPGVTNLMAKAAADQLDQVDEVHIAFASFRAIAPSPGLLDTVLDEFSPGSRRFFWQRASGQVGNLNGELNGKLDDGPGDYPNPEAVGEFVEVPAFSGAKQVRFADPVGAVETYYVPHSETHTIHRFINKAVKLVDVRGTWQPEIMQALRVFADLGLTGEQTVNLDGQAIATKQLVRAHILQHAANFGGEGEWAFLLNVEVNGERDGRPTRIEYISRHPLRAEWGTGATAKMTGIPASIAAQKLARGEVARKGVLAPEACFDPQSFFAELAKRRIFIEERR